MNEILFILVIYEQELEATTAYKSLQGYFDDDELKSLLYVHDNTKKNVYLAQAYNDGIKVAKERGKKWIALLDDDFFVGSDYLENIKQIANGGMDSCAVPKLFDSDGKCLSPQWYNHQSGPFKMLYDMPSGHADTMVAFNAGAIFNIAMLEAALGSFNTEYPIDYLDYDTFYRLNQQRIEPIVMPVKMQHDLSLANEKYIGEQRYKSLLKAEKRFALQLNTHSAVTWYKLRLCGRIVKWAITCHAYVGITIKHLLNI